MLSSILQLDRGWLGPAERYPPYVVATIEKDGMRILLEGPRMRMWFLREKTHLQYTARFHREPFDPPLDINWSYNLTGDFLDGALNGF